MGEHGTRLPAGGAPGAEEDDHDEAAEEELRREREIFEGFLQVQHGRYWEQQCAGLHDADGAPPMVAGKVEDKFEGDGYEEPGGPRVENLEGRKGQESQSEGCLD